MFKTETTVNYVCEPKRLIRHCRVCDSTNLESAIDLGFQPWANHFLTAEEVGTEPFYPLVVVYCHNCSAVQLNYTVDKEIMFGDRNTYLSGVTKTLDSHFRAVAEEVDKRFFKNIFPKRVLDIGSNDGSQLKHYQDLNYEVLGIESAKTIAEIANKRGIATVNAFFNSKLVYNLGLLKKFDVINAAGVFFHLEELHSVTEGIKEALKDEGVFVVQFLYAKSIIENKAFDLIYHEHLLLYTLETIEKLLNRHQLSMFDAYFSPIHGGSIIAFITHQNKIRPSDRLQKLRKAEEKSKINELETFKNFVKVIEVLKQENLEYLSQVKNQGKRIFGFGAPVKGNTLLNYFGIGLQYLDCLVEKNKLKVGLYSPGMHLPVLFEDELSELPDIYYVLAWNFKKEILSNNQHLLDKGVEFYFPINPVVDF